MGQVDNGRTYLREMVFGDPSEPHHAAALDIVAQTEHAVASILTEKAGVPTPQAEALARVVSAIQFLVLGASVNTASPIPQLLADIRTQVAAILPR